MKCSWRIGFLVAAAMLTLPPVAHGWPQAAATHPQAAVLADGWSALARGELAQASAAAQRALVDSPHSAAAVALAVEVALVRQGPTAGLDAYEQWLGARRIDEAYVLRRIATAHLQHIVREREAGAPRVQALKALVADGDRDAGSALAQAAQSGGLLETRVLASLGDERSVRSLIARLDAMPDRSGAITDLIDSRSPLAIPPLVDLLGHPREELRASAADALGKLNAHDTVERIKPLLKDTSFAVRLSAAGALYRLQDDAGAPLLDKLLSSDHAAVRLSAAEALSVRPGGAWQSVARALTTASDETVRLNAARLMAPYDRELAERVLTQLQQSPNPAIREEAARTIAERVANDFAGLRRLLRSSDAAVVVHASARVLELTR